jgi:hypothetical protein
MDRSSSKPKVPFVGEDANHSGVKRQYETFSNTNFKIEKADQIGTLSSHPFYRK